jgi:UDP-N-acetyl-D-mannosaminuronate dehydrogenase
LEYNSVKLESLITLNKSVLNSFDVCCVLTDHSEVDYNLVAENSKLIVDTRNVFRNIKGQNIKRLGEG